MRKLFLMAVCAGGIAISSTASAQQYGASYGATARVTGPQGAAAGSPAFAFDNQGDIVISTDFSFSVQHISESAPNGGGSDSVTTVLLQPSIDYFVIDQLSIGGGLSYGHNAVFAGLAPVKNSYGVHVRAGFDIPVADNFSIWPQAGFYYVGSSEDGGNTTDPTTGATVSNTISTSEFGFEAFVPLMIHPVHHFFIGLGPNLSTDFSSKVSEAGQSADAPKLTTIGAKTVIGGWF